MAKVTEVRKIGEWYRVEGVGSDGRKISMDVHAKDVDGSANPHKVFRRAVDVAEDYQHEERRG